MRPKRERSEPYRVTPTVQEVIDLERSKSILLGLPGSPLRDARLMEIESALGKEGLVSFLENDIQALQSQVETHRNEVLRLKAIIQNYSVEKTHDLDYLCDRKCPFRTFHVE